MLQAGRAALSQQSRVHHWHHLAPIPIQVILLILCPRNIAAAWPHPSTATEARTRFARRRNRPHKRASPVHMRLSELMSACTPCAPTRHHVAPHALALPGQPRQARKNDHALERRHYSRARSLPLGPRATVHTPKHSGHHTLQVTAPKQSPERIVSPLPQQLCHSGAPLARPCPALSAKTYPNFLLELSHAATLPCPSAQKMRTGPVLKHIHTSFRPIPGANAPTSHPPKHRRIQS